MTPEDKLADARALADHLTSLLADQGRVNARLAVELSEALAEVKSWRQAAEERAEALDAFAAQLDELHAERTSPA